MRINAKIVAAAAVATVAVAASASAHTLGLLGSPDLKAHIGALKQTPSTRSASYAILSSLPTGLIGGQHGRQGGGSDAGVPLARFANGGRLVLSAFNGLMCLDDGAAASTCNTPSAALSGYLTGATLCGPGLPPGKIHYYGLVPDGVRTVRLLGVDGAAGSVPVTRNGFAAELAVSPTGFTYTDAGGTHSVATPIPSKPQCADVRSPDGRDIRRDTP